VRDKEEAIGFISNFARLVLSSLVSSQAKKFDALFLERKFKTLSACLPVCLPASSPAPMCTVDRQQILKMTDTRNHDDHDGLDSSVASLPSASKVRETISRINEPQSRETNLTNLVSLGSIEGIASFLQTNPSCGLCSSSISQRRSLYGCNALPSSPRKTWFQLFVDSFDDETVQILIAAAIVSLLVGIYDDPTTGYVEGCAILAAVLVVSIVTACNDYQKETQFRALSKANDDVQVLVKRDNRIVSIPIDEIVLGDVICVEAGDSIPCDGLLVKADSLSIDESALTGEPMDVEKNLVHDPFVLSGCIATAGTAEFLAIAVGKDSQWGIIKAHLEKEQDQTPLQEKLDHMAQVIGYVGMAAAAATFLAMMFIYCVVQPEYLKDTSFFAHALDAFIIGVTIVVVAVPEGLPLAVTIALAYSTKKMLRDKNLIRHLAACETMGNATNICSDKTGTLTENRMTVVKGIFANVRQEDTAPESNTVLDRGINGAAREIILQGIATCSTARILPKVQPQDLASGEDWDNRTHVVGNKTEGALLILAQSAFMGGDDYETRRARAQFGLPGGSRLFPFSSKRKRMSVLIKESTEENGGRNEWTLYHKGAGEIVLENCSSYLDKDGSILPMTPEKKREFEEIISSFASQALRCVALAHRPNIHNVIDPDTCTEDDCASKCEKEMTLDALVGIVDPLRGDVVEAVKTCQKAGIFVRMVTGDNLETANAIAKQAGILTKGEYWQLLGCNIFSTLYVFELTVFHRYL
jgi:plasma-membrane calcium-translocating P-type ATPase